MFDLMIQTPQGPCTFSFTWSEGIISKEKEHKIVFPDQDVIEPECKVCDIFEKCRRDNFFTNLGFETKGWRKWNLI